MKAHRLTTNRINRKSFSAGFTLVEIMIVVMILGLLFAIATPSFVHARDNSRCKACVQNLKRISGAKEEYALENRLPVGSNHVFVWADLTPYIGNIQTSCPSGTPGQYVYVPQTLGTQATCPYGAPATDPTLVHQYLY